MTEWDDLADWWAGEERDAAYRDDVQPIVESLLDGLPGPTLDLGCGSGRLTPALPQPAFGVDSSQRLLTIARRKDVGVVRLRLPELDAVRPGVVNGAFACLVLEHIPDATGFFENTYAVVGDGGWLVVVSNHPAFTSAGAGPVIDGSDGEVLWRWGTYLFDSVVAEPAGEGSVVFHHRSMAAILNAAAAAGWILDRLVEAGASGESIERIPALAGQEHMPRLVGFRWRRGR